MNYFLHKQFAVLTAFFCMGMLPISHSFAHDNAEIREIISDGVGRDTAEAAQNAAQNALTNVVGSFIDANKALEKQVEIQNGIRNEVRNVSTNIKEYSQGSIKGFEILDVSGAEGGFVRVRARVLVRVEDFRAYIQKLASTEVSINEGLFAQMQMEQKQSTNIGNILYENVLLPIVEGTTVTFKSGAPAPFRQLNIPDSALWDPKFNDFTSAHDPSRIVAFNIEAQLDFAFLENLTTTLSSTANEKTLVTGNVHRNTKPGNWASKYDWTSDIALALQRDKAIHGSNEHFDVFLFLNAKRELEKKSPWTAALVTGVSSGLWNGKHQTFYKNFPTPSKSLTVEFTDQNGNVLQSDQASVDGGSSGSSVGGGRILVLNQGQDTLDGPYFSAPWSLVGMASSGGGVAVPVIRRGTNFIVLIATEDSTLRNAKAIVIKLTE